MEQNGNISWDPHQAIPPWNWVLAARVGGSGAILVLAGGCLGLLGETAPEALRVVLIVVGSLLSAVAASHRPFDPLMWFFLSLTFALGWVGSPHSWDSLALLTLIGSWLALLGGILASVPLRVRLVGITTLVIVHFLGILTAVTGPPPQPWLTGQTWTRVYRPYLQWSYLNNAYQFYSPDPGPSNQMWAAVEFETTDPERQRKWFRFPERPEHVKDPLAMTYYRRLSLTEHLNGTDSMLSVYEDGTAKERRMAYFNLSPPDKKIPLGTPHHQAGAFRAPDWELRRRLLPAYAKMIARQMEEEEGLPVKSLKLYRVEHRVIDPTEMQKPARERRGPYHKTQYLPYYLGKYDNAGTLLDSDDPMLYWLVPIVERTSQVYGSTTEKGYNDWLSVHAGIAVDWRQR